MKYILDENDPLFKKQLNKYSFPFNGGYPDSISSWLERLEPFKPFIHDIFLSCPNSLDFFSKNIIKMNSSDYLDRCAQLLQILKDTKEYKSVVTLNGNYTLLSLSEKYELANKVAEQVYKYDIYGCVISNFDIAQYLHELCPNLVLNTSCNIPQYSVSLLDAYKSFINIINPSRNSSRNISLLKDFYNHGFKVKLMLNEPCDLTCPNICTHCPKSQDISYLCYGFRTKQSPLHSCIILPRWLNIFDEFVDHYKLTGRYNKNQDYILNQFKYYLTRSDDCFLHEFHPNVHIPIPVKEIPDQLLYCNQVDCDSCKLCDQIFYKCVERTSI